MPEQVEKSLFKPIYILIHTAQGKSNVAHAIQAVVDTSSIHRTVKNKIRNIAEHMQMEMRFKSLRKLLNFCSLFESARSSAK